MNAGPAEALKLSFYFGEHDRYDGRFLSDAVLDLFERHRLATGVLLRGAEGFGAGQRLQTDRVLSLSEDLPLIALAVDGRERVQALLPELVAIAGGGLITLERARFAGAGHQPSHEPHEEVKLTVYTGRRQRHGGTPAHVAVVAALHRHGVAGATTLVGVDGVSGGHRLRARFFGANAWVPAVTIAVGERERIDAALAELNESLERPLATLETIRVCRRDGRKLADPQPLAGDDDGLDFWRKLMVYCSERSEHRGRALYLELIRRLRVEGAAGATALRGVWGYHGDHAPHGDRLLALRRHVPIVTAVVDTPSRSERWFEIAAELTGETGLVTSEIADAVVLVPAQRDELRPHRRRPHPSLL